MENRENIITLNPYRKKMASLKIGFNHTCEKHLDSLLLELKSKVIRTYFTVEDVKRAYDINAEPYVGVRFMPSYLSADGKRESPPKSYREWGEHVSDTISDILRAGMKPKYYGVWNEPERIEEPIFWQGNMDDYIRLYESTAYAIKRVDPTSWVGGPETTSYNEIWIKKLLEESNKRNFDVDFLSFHQFEDPSQIVEHANLARTIFSGLKGKTPEVHIGEWGFKIKNAYLALQHLAEAEDAEVGFYCKDFFFEKKWKCNVIDDDHQKRDMFYLFKEYSKLGDLRYFAKTNDSSTKVIAGLSNESLALLISNRSDLPHPLKYRLFSADQKRFKIHSLDEISQDGLISRDFENELGTAKFELDCKKAYIIKGEIK